MTVLEELERINDTELVYLGSGSSYIYIANKSDVIEKLDELDARYRKRNRARILSNTQKIENKRGRLNSIRNRLPINRSELETRTKRLEELKNKKASIVLREKQMGVVGDHTPLDVEIYQLKSAIKILKGKIAFDEQMEQRYPHEMDVHAAFRKECEDIEATWVPIKERQVIRIYRRPVLEPGTVVIFSGTEIGDYWFLSEVSTC